MSISAINTGWKPWSLFHTSIKSPSGTIDVASASNVSSYFPANEFIVSAPSNNCELTLPWVYTGSFGGGFSLFNQFAFQGGVLDVVSAMGVMSAMNILLTQPTSITWAINQSNPVTIGFCIGDSYKEHCYLYVSAIKGEGELGSALKDAGIDIFQRSRLKRLYVKEGIVSGFIPDESTPSQFIISLGIEGEVPSGVDSVVGNSITVYKRGGGTIPCTIVSLRPNWDVVVTKTSTLNPEIGDFYTMSNIWCIEDPYMMSGFLDSPTFQLSSTAPPDPNPTVKSTHNVFNLNVKFIGVYIYKEIGGTITYAPPGKVFGEDPDYEWIWMKYPGMSKAWKNLPERYYVNGALIQFNAATASDLSAWTSLSGVEYVRLEIDIGGSASLNNWHSPNLKKCFLYQGGHYFSILGQPLGNIIDVSLRDVTGMFSLSYSSGSGGYIFNQYAWMINEHYYPTRGANNADNRGFAENVLFLLGKAESAVYDAATNITRMNVIVTPIKGGTNATYSKNNLNWGAFTGTSPSTVNSFYNRFVQTYGGDSFTKKMWKKFNGWKMAAYEDTSFTPGKNGVFDPSTLVISNSNPNYYSADNITQFSVDIIGDFSTSAYAAFYFDEPYSISGSDTSTLRFVLNEVLGSDGKSIKLCCDFDYSTSNIKTLLPSNSVVGITGGSWWGDLSYGERSNISNDGAQIYLSTFPVQRNSSCFYHYIREQDWIFHKEKSTDKLILRTGNLEFRDTPRRTEIAIGYSNSVASAISFPLTFDITQDRVKLISMKLPLSGGTSTTTDIFNPSAMTFQLGSPDWYFGFPSSGNGIVDFKALRDNGIGPGTTPSNQFKGKNGNNISPVYVYTKRTNDIAFCENATLELGVSTKDGPLYVKNGSPTDIKIEYCSEKQTLQNVGFFDTHLMQDGEIIVFYGKNTKDFTMNGIGTTVIDWETQECIYAVSSPDNALRWGTPNVHDINYNADINYQYPVMLLNSCVYRTSFYNPLSDVFGLVTICYNPDGEPFIGCFIIPCESVSKDLNICTPSSSSDLPFWLRTIRLPTSILTDATKSYVNPPFVLNGIFGSDTATDDIFTRVMGKTITNSDIEIECPESSILTASSFVNGGAVIFYNDTEGARMLSTNNLRKWDRSKIILAKNAESIIMVGDHLFYIGLDGIYIKFGILELLIQASTATDNAGIDPLTVNNIQAAFDNNIPYLIWAGTISSQRISGYITEMGIYKIFYYDSSEILCCLSSSDCMKWGTSDNF